MTTPMEELQNSDGKVSLTDFTNGFQQLLLFQNSITKIHCFLVDILLMFNFCRRKSKKTQNKPKTI